MLGSVVQVSCTVYSECLVYYTVQWVSCTVYCTVGEGFGTVEALQGWRVQGGARGDNRACHDDDMSIFAIQW